MPKFYIHAINSVFRSRDEGSEYDKPEDALTMAIQSATAIAADEINSGKPSTAIEVRIEEADGTPLLRSVISLSVAPLLPTVDFSEPRLQLGQA